MFSSDYNCTGNANIFLWLLLPFQSTEELLNMVLPNWKNPITWYLAQDNALSEKLDVKGQFSSVHLFFWINLLFLKTLPPYWNNLNLHRGSYLSGNLPQWVISPSNQSKWLIICYNLLIKIKGAQKKSRIYLENRLKKNSEITLRFGLGWRVY